MVELEPVPEEDDLLESEHHHGGDFEHHGRVDISSDMTRYDEERLKNLITRHLKLTKSDIAKKILDDWNKFKEFKNGGNDPLSIPFGWGWSTAFFYNVISTKISL